MPYTVQEFQPTPNPNALKCVLDQPLPEPIRSFRSAAEAATDPLGSALFAVPGVTSVLLSGGWLTVNKTADARWPGVKKGVQDALKRA
jgi:hypothetical protein